MKIKSFLRIFFFSVHVFVIEIFEENLMGRHLAAAWGTGVPPHCKGVWGEEREEVNIILGNIS